MKARAFACIEVGGSGAQTVLFGTSEPAFVDGVVTPEHHLVGLAVPGRIEGMLVKEASNLGWHNANPAKILKLTEPMLVLCNDAEATALGEWVLRGQVDDSLVYVGLGTGIGGATIRGGRVSQENLFGHMTGFGNKICSCGERGCLETVAAGWSLPPDLDGSDAQTAGAAIATAIEREPDAAAGVVVVGGGLARNRPAIVEAIAIRLRSREVVPTGTPPQAKSAAAWGTRLLLKRLGDETS